MQAGKHTLQIMIGMGGLGGGAWVQAQTAQYLVQFHSPSHLQALTQDFASHGSSALANVLKGAELSQTLPDLGVAQVLATPEQAENLKADPDVAHVELDYMFQLPPSRLKSFDHMTSSSGYQDQGEVPWGLAALKTEEAWKVSPALTMGQGARVLVLDSGVDPHHEDLKDRLEKGRNFLAPPPTFFKFGFFSFGPKNFPQPDAEDFHDEEGHGTHVSGTILGSQNSLGVAGVAPEAKLLMGKVCGIMGCPTSAILKGIEWGMEEGVDVINMSLGGGYYSEIYKNALQRAYESGVLVVAAAGNDGKDTVDFPAAYPQTLAVGALDRNLLRADFSHYGSKLDIMAPGVDVLSAVPMGQGRRTEVVLHPAGGQPEAIPSEGHEGSGMGALEAREVVDGKSGSQEEIQAAAPEGKIIFVRRSAKTPLSDQVIFARQAGAVAVIVPSPVDAPMPQASAQPSTGVNSDILVLSVGRQAGMRMSEMLQQGFRFKVQAKHQISNHMTMSGTSMATPHVSGVAALIAGINPALEPDEIKKILLTTARPLPGTDKLEYGAGLVNAAKAVHAALESLDGFDDPSSTDFAQYP